MNLLEFTARYSDARDKSVLVLSTTAVGATSTLCLTLVSAAAQQPAERQLASFLLFSATLALHLYVMRHSSHKTSEMMETVLTVTRKRIIDKIARTDLLRIETIGTAEFFDRLTQNMSQLSASSYVIGGMVLSAFMGAFGAIYVFLVSPAAFLLLLPLVALVLLAWRRRTRDTGGFLERNTQARVRVLDLLMGLLRGAKEVKLNSARSREIREDFRQASAELRDVSVAFTQAYDDNTLLVNCSLYGLLAILSFVLPQVAAVEATTLSSLVVAIMFIWGNLTVGVMGVIGYVQSNQALLELEQLEASLADLGEEDPVDHPWRGRPGHPGRLTLEAVAFEYPAAAGETPFRVGPLDLTIAAGELLFVVGGNGAGKSTLLKLLTGLYPPKSGVMRLGERVVDAHNAAAYREQIAVIFSDFHLFSRLYGLLDVDPAAVQPLLADMQLADKTAFEAGQFTRRDLSTGQRKRLAMIVALLEDRPIFVLDEWAADQDPEFRGYFYQQLLPALKRRGKTVIAVSHDDRYFHHADRVVVMEYGEIRSIEATPRSPAGESA